MCVFYGDFVFEYASHTSSELNIIHCILHIHIYIALDAYIVRVLGLRSIRAPPVLCVTVTLCVACLAFPRAGSLLSLHLA